MSKAICYNKTYPIFSCDFMDGAIITKLYEVIDEKHMPIILQNGNFNIKSVNEWLALRKIPENREGLEEARKRFRDFLNYSNMFSLSDQYWFQFTQKENWKKGNFFTNTYQNETGKIFFAPWDVNEALVKKRNPDITTNGVLKKRWIQQENEVSYLIKAGSRKYEQNPISEILASMFLERLDIIPFVQYELVVDNLKICSKCKNFIDADTEFVPVTQIYYKTDRDKEKGETVYEHLVKQSVAYGLNEEYVKHYLDAMITADVILHNTDRHLNNFGYIRDVESGRIISFAPLFDSGSAFSESKVKKTQDMFKDKRKRAVQKTLEPLSLESFSNEPMLQMVAAFPTLTRDEKKLIKQKIEQSTEMIKRGGKKLKPREIIEDRFL